MVTTHLFKSASERSLLFSVSFLIRVALGELVDIESLVELLSVKVLLIKVIPVCYDTAKLAACVVEVCLGAETVRIDGSLVVDARCESLSADLPLVLFLQVKQDLHLLKM